ncbi:MAG: hypothetical protein AB7O24_04355 [Kofleriaceae bacterium]
MSDINDDTDQYRRTPTMLWARHPGDRFFHSIEHRNLRGSTCTRCNGRWPTNTDVEISYCPPQHERCECCQRLLIDVIRIEQGLTELEEMTRDRNTWRTLACGLRDRLRELTTVPA